MGFLSTEYEDRLLKVGQKILTPTQGTFTVIDKDSDDLFTIQFDETGTIAGPYTEHECRVCHVEDPYAKRYVGGVASIGNVDKSMLTFNNRIYRTWYDMLDRCYNPNNKRYKNYGGSNVTVCERWKCFEFFLQDVSKIPGFDSWLIAGEREYHLDKDLKQLDSPNKIYSLETCLFVPAHINQQEMLLRRTVKRQMCHIIKD